MGVSSFFKNLFGKANIDVDSIANQAESLASDAIAKTKEVSSPLVDKMEDFAETAKEKIMEYVPAAEETIDNIIETVKEKASEYSQKAEELAKSTTSETVKEKITDLTSDAEPAKVVEETVEKIEEDKK
jgi:gas vesicle protein